MSRVNQDLKQMESNLAQYPSEEVERLKARAIKFLDYAADKKAGKRESKILSLSLMILIERAKAVDEFQRKHKYRTMSRWDHFMAIFDSRRIYK